MCPNDSPYRLEFNNDAVFHAQISEELTDILPFIEDRYRQLSLNL